MAGGIEGVEWIAVDWGTSHLRAWAMVGPDARAEVASDAGMRTLAPDQFEKALLGTIGPWLGDARRPVIACGMVGARQGWVEAPYVPAPCLPPVHSGLARVPATDGRIDMLIVPGLCRADPADVMRGEETQIAGYLASAAGFGGTICLPGTHSKWVRVAEGKITWFRTFMTGEVFELLAHGSILRHSVGPGWDDAAFDLGVAKALSRPSDVPAALFSIRARSLLEGMDPGQSRARLSGLLIGAELAATRAEWAGRKVVLIGASDLARLYARALGAQTEPPERADGPAMTRAGLHVAYMSTREAHA